MKPDIVVYGKNLVSLKITVGCRSLSGTSVASPVVAGAVALLISTIPEERRKSLVNPASLKQVLIESAEPVANAHLFEQGSGLMNLVKAYELIQTYTPKASVSPSNLDLTKCPYAWPYCKEPLYHTRIPLMMNLTILNGMSLSGRLLGEPAFTTYEAVNSDLLDVKFTYPSVLWPWSGWLGVYLSVRENVPAPRYVQGMIRFTVVADHGQRSEVVSAIKLRVVPTPPRSKRILWDQFHNLRYPSGYFPRDNLEERADILDWNGDHPHTNFNGLFNHLVRNY